MISVENFYWVLYENLLKPVGLDCWYYFPFGTTDDISAGGEFQQPSARRADLNHVLFHYDQEPIWTTTLGKKYNHYTMVVFSSKFAKILANSEISQLKKNICSNMYLLDWYYFYHGFASLNWFRDCQYIDSNLQFSKKFSSFNHLVRDHRSYRMAMIARLYALDAIKYGDVSFYGTRDDFVEEIENPNTQLSDASKVIITKNLDQFNNFPLVVDQSDVNSTFSAKLGHREYKLWQRSFLHIVNETVFYDPKLHLTEKSFKPIVSLRPFVLVAATGNLAYLRRYGFRTFGDWIDESYDDIVDPDLRLDEISNQVHKICSLSITQLQDLYKDMLPTLEYNKRHFFGEFRRIIVDELVDNFDQCIRIWNNGRVDGRELPLHPDLDRVKRILMI